MDNWINWGDFIGANQGALDDYRRSVEGDQAAQEKAMQAAMQQLSMDTEEANNAAQMATSAANSYDAKAAVDSLKAQDMVDKAAKAGFRGNAKSPQPNVPPPPPLPGAQLGQQANPLADITAATGNATRLAEKQKASYADLMAAGAKGMTYTHANPGASAGESAMYGQQAKYTNPWEGFEKKANEVGTLKTGSGYDYGAASSAAAQRYNDAKTKQAEDKANAQAQVPAPPAETSSRAKGEVGTTGDWLGTAAGSIKDAFDSLGDTIAGARTKYDPVTGRRVGRE